ncbi:MAG: SAM-dependent methyltransferase, partial [Pseudomonadota bacterium]
MTDNRREDAIKTAATTSMKGGGYYSQSTQGAKHAIDNAANMLLDAVADLPEPASGAPLRIADFGAADGGTSKETIARTVAALRNRWPDRQIQVNYTDLASNDWSQLFKSMQGLDGSGHTYWNPGEGVFVSGIGIGFHNQLLLDESLDLGFSATAMHYVSERPCTITGHVHHVGAQSDELAAFDRQAALDWERILIARASELRPGGRLVF